MAVRNVAHPNVDDRMATVPSQPSEVPWSSPTASTVGATGARTAATTETTAATASSTNLERLTAQVARRIEGEAGYELRCRTA